MRTAGDAPGEMFQLLTWCPQRDWPRPTGTLNMLGAGLQGMMGPERTQTAPGPGWTRRPADALCWAASLFSACVSCGGARQLDTPRPPHQLPSRPGRYGPRTGAAQAGGTGEQDAPLDWAGCPRVGCPGVRMLHVAKQGAPWPWAPYPDTLPPSPAPPSLTLGEHRKGGVLSLRTGCVCPVAAAPQEPGQARGWGRHRARLSPSPSS